MRIKIDKCYKCLCNSCSKFNCQYKNRCDVCNHQNMCYVFDCDFFESVHLAPKRLKVKRYQGSKTDIINTKLDFIINHLGIEPPKADAHGTYDLMYKDYIVARFNKRKDAVDYKNKIQPSFKTELEIRKVEIDL